MFNTQKIKKIENREVKQKTTPSLVNCYYWATLYTIAAGNLIEDRSKRLKISYDWRGMPIEFIQEPQPTCSSGNSLFRLAMAYDGSGRRISKTRWVKSANSQDWEKDLVTHYTGIGTEIRENPGNNEAKVVMNMPNGLGRYEPEDAAVPPSSSTSRTFEWCLKNHLGSTMLVYASAYGTPIELVSTNGADMRRWQSKEFDWLYGKYNFGARYYDPFFGLWMSPDPAGQFANPYTYGGDPLNYVDPMGMWSFNLDLGGLVVGFDSQRGWGFGVGAAAEYGGYGLNASYMFHQDGSNTLNLGVDAKIPIQTPYVYIEINMGLGFSMNSYTGAVLSSHGGACVGEVGACVGVDQGGSLYFDRGGGFQGATVYMEVYAQLGSPYGGTRISTGYEAGLLGAEGRGMYAGLGLQESLHNKYKTISIDNNLFLGVSQRDGFSAGFSSRLKLDPIEMSTFGKPRKGVVKASGHGMETENAADGFAEFDTYLSGKMDKDGVYTIGGHGLKDYPFMLLGDRIIDAMELYEKVKDLGAFREATTVKLNVCYAAKTRQGRNFAQEFADISGKTVIASEHKVTFYSENHVFAGGRFEFWHWSDWQTIRPSNSQLYGARPILK